MRLIIRSLLLCFILESDCYKILGIFPYNGRSHHIFHSSLVEELANRNHDVTVINYHALKKTSTLRQIFLENQENRTDNVDIGEHLKVMTSDLFMSFSNGHVFKYLANTNCRKLIRNLEVQEMIKSKEFFDVVIVEQFVTDCGLAVAYKLNAPTVGLTAHILMPWTYSRLGAPNNAAYVQNHFFASGTTPNILNRIKSTIINFGMNMYFTYVIQATDQEIVNELYPEVPSLEEIGKNMSLIMLNQYFPITGPRLYGPNVIEIGGMQIHEDVQGIDKALQNFLDASDTGVVYISFGTVAVNFPRKVIEVIQNLILKNNLRFVWKTDTDTTYWKQPGNAFLRKWLPQVPLLCHPKVVAFVTHSGMLSTSEAMHCGVPVVSVPIFGDQFANGLFAVENGLGVTVDITRFNNDALENAIVTVLQDKYQKRAKKLSQLWRERPISPMDTAIYWIEYVARHKQDINMRPPTVDLPFYEFFMLDILLLFISVITMIALAYSIGKCVISVRDRFRMSFIFLCHYTYEKIKKEYTAQQSLGNRRFLGNIFIFIYFCFKVYIPIDAQFNA